jgi:hypothetical protein
MLGGFDCSIFSVVADYWPSVAAADLVMMMPDSAAMTAISAIMIPTTTIHSSIIARAVHAAAMIVTHLPVIHSIFAPRHCSVAMPAIHIAASMLVHRLRPRGTASAAMSAIRRSGWLHLGESRHGERQHADRGKCHHFHGISPRSRDTARG